MEIQVPDSANQTQDWNRMSSQSKQVIVIFITSRHFDLVLKPSWISGCSNSAVCSECFALQTFFQPSVVRSQEPSSLQLAAGVRFKTLPFYTVHGVLVPPTILGTQGAGRLQNKLICSYFADQVPRGHPAVRAHVPTGDGHRLQQGHQLWEQNGVSLSGDISQRHRGTEL